MVIRYRNRNPKNLIPFPYVFLGNPIEKVQTKNGVTFTLNDDGTVTANGTSTAQVVYYIFHELDDDEPIPIKAGKYSFSDGGVNETWDTHMLTGNYIKENGSEEYFSIGTQTLENGRLRGLYILIREGVKLNSVTFKPMLNEGTKALLYYAESTFKPKFSPYNLFDKSLIRLGGTDFANCSEYQLSTDKNTMIARGGSDDTTNEFMYARGWVRGGSYESAVNSKGIKLKKGDVVTVSADFTLIEQGNRSAAVRCYLYSNHPAVSIFDTVARSISETPQRITWKFTVTDDADDYYPLFPINSNKVKIENIFVSKTSYSVRNPKNLIPFPYVDKSKTMNGITFTVRDDGSVKVEGTATGTAQFYFSYGTNLELPTGKPITISGGVAASGEYGKITVNLRKYVASGSTASFIDSNGNSSTGTLLEGETPAGCSIYISSVGAKFNTIIYPMLNEGSVAEPYYKKYINPSYQLRSGVIRRNPKNLIPFEYMDRIGVRGGILYDVYNDGTVWLSGLSDAPSEIVLTYGLDLPKGVYTYKLNLSNYVANIYGYIACILDGAYVAFPGKISVSADQLTRTFEITQDMIDAGYKIRLNIYVQTAGVQVDGVIIEPVLNEGARPEPYFVYY